LDAPSNQALTAAAFADRLETLFPLLASKRRLAVAVSGGGDSVALMTLLAHWAKPRSIEVHVLTVNHGLRAEAAAEARQVGVWSKDLGLIHKTLKWDGDKPASKIQEEARAARYRLMAEYCHSKKIADLFLAHHQDDQAETILFRLAKGSGIDGLSGMSATQVYNESLSLLRPLLDVSHSQLIATCKKAGIKWFEDISNVSDLYSRVRLRKSADILAAEGLTSARLATLGARLERAAKGLEQITDLAWKKTVQIKETKRIVFTLGEVLEYPEEIILRLLQKGLGELAGKRRYPPSLEALEKIAAGIYDRDSSFRAATLANCVIRRSKTKNTLTIEREKV
jgi:tRNA(Ile)-lysidine synthase